MHPFLGKMFSILAAAVLVTFKIILWTYNSTFYHSYSHCWHHLHHHYHHYHHHNHLNKASWFHLLALNCLRPDQAHPLLSPGDSLKQQQISSQLSSSDSLKVMTTINITIVINIVINHCCLRHCTKVAALIRTSYMWAKISSVTDTSAPCFYLCRPNCKYLQLLSFMAV